jgi:hypothetical protein
VARNFILKILEFDEFSQEKREYVTKFLLNFTPKERLMIPTG